MIINKEYILSRLNFLVKEKEIKSSDRNNTRLIKIKYLFPAWLRKFIFSPYNPLFAMYKQVPRKSSLSQVPKKYALHPVPVDFMSYCFQNDINFNTHDFFSPDDEPLIKKHIDERIKCILREWYDNPNNECSKIEQQLLKNVKKTKSGYNLLYEGISYCIPQNTFSYPVFCAHYGLKMLPHNVLEYIKGKDFLDIGALDGDASVMFLQYKPSRIFAYEPASLNYQLLLKTIELQKNDKIYAVKKGIGDKETTMEFNVDSTYSGANTLLNNLSINKGQTETIEVTTIDKENQDKKIGLIKMDIEGFEYYAIKGGAETIKRDKPVLLISIYHTGKDFFEIPTLLKLYVPEYKFKYLDIAPYCDITDKIIAAYVE
jgi:FkbM family methyltransferase